eukprot:474203-Hanusia_phi.AAC.2
MKTAMMMIDYHYDDDDDVNNHGGGLGQRVKFCPTEQVLLPTRAYRRPNSSLADYASFRRALLKEGVESSLTNLSGRLGQGSTSPPPHSLPPLPSFPSFFSPPFLFFDLTAAADYAAFKRSLLAEGADSSLPYRNAPVHTRGVAFSPHAP